MTHTLDAAGLEAALQAAADVHGGYMSPNKTAAVRAAITAYEAARSGEAVDGFEPHDFEYVHGLLTVATEDDKFLRAALSNNLNIILAALRRAALPREDKAGPT